MSLYRRGRIWWMDFHFHGQRVQESTGMSSITRAREVEAKRKQALRDGAAGIRKRQHPQLLSAAAKAWLEMKTPTLAAKTVAIEKTNLGHLLPLLGKKLLVDFEPRDIAQYQQSRIAEGASPKTVNLEVGTLRAILKRHGQWARLQPDVRMLPAREDVGRALTPEEESALLLECGRSRSRALPTFVTLAIETGARYNVVRTLQWGNVDFARRCLRWGKDKTPSGTGRIVPLNPRALAALQFWAQNFPNRQPGHYVFPSEKCGGAGCKDNFGFSAGAKVYDSDPTKPVGDVKEAWEAARKRTRRHCPQCKTGILADKPKPERGYACIECRFESEELPAGLVGVRFHDLRHSAVSRMLNARVPITKIAQIVGWSTATAVRMASRYGHFSLEELREAVDSISSPPNGNFKADSLQFSLQSEGDSVRGRAN